MAFYEGHGTCSLKEIESGNVKEFSNKFELDGITFNEPNVHFFSFNNPFGACPECEGYGKVIGIDEDLVIPNKNLSVFEDAVACWPVSYTHLDVYKRQSMSTSLSVG